MKLYNDSKPFECDLTASKCIFWKFLPKPQYLYDKYPQVEGVKPLSEADLLPNKSFSSIVYDLPFIVSNGAMSKIKERFTHFESVEELYQANDEMLERSFRLLKKQGLLIVKTMDISHGNKQIWISDYVIRKAEELGLELIEKFILLSNLRLFARTHQQRVARKYHSYFFVFKKKSTAPLNKVKALLLDFDHTIFNTDADCEVRKNSKVKDWDLIFSKIPEYKLYDGWSEVFDDAKAKGIKIAIVSTAKKELIERTLKHFQLDCDVIIGWQRCYKKPNPKLVEMALNKLKVNKEDVISVGDDVVDKLMSDNGGVRFIGAIWDCEHEESIQELKQGTVLNSPTDLLSYI
ncbi:MAG: HAD family hydrolase [Alistipes sp.]|nr:HAD family hydrolase [Alistipes sp.]